VQVATEDGHIFKLLAETSASRARSKCNRAFAGWGKPQTFGTAPAARENGENREAVRLSWRVHPSRKGARFGEVRHILLPLSCTELL